MPRQFSTPYIIAFSGAVCIVCSLVVSTLAVGLKDRQTQNALLDQQKNVLMAAGVIEPGQKVKREQIPQLFADVKPVIIDLKTGAITEQDPQTFDQMKATKDPAQSEEAPENRAGLQRIPHKAKIYRVVKNENVEQVILPISGKGLWSTLYGFLAVDKDGQTIRGITFYQHGETPGLGGEIDNPRWKALWKGRKAFGEDFEVKLEVIKGTAGSVEDDPYRVDGLSGATITARGVSHLVQFWLGEHGFRPYLKQLRSNGKDAS
jgi:Na+-transporting NADH:ubiquinone oxidoreductase subunit C